MYYVYILKGDRHYVGYTNNIERRLKEHRRGKTFTTKRIGDFKLLGYFLKETKQEAIKLERKIKRNGHIEFRKNHETFINK